MADPGPSQPKKGMMSLRIKMKGKKEKRVKDDPKVPQINIEHPSFASTYSSTFSRSMNNLAAIARGAPPEEVPPLPISPRPPRIRQPTDLGEGVSYVRTIISGKPAASFLSMGQEEVPTDFTGIKFTDSTRPSIMDLDYPDLVAHPPLPIECPSDAWMHTLAAIKYANADRLDTLGASITGSSFRRGGRKVRLLSDDVWKEVFLETAFPRVSDPPEGSAGDFIATSWTSKSSVLAPLHSHVLSGYLLAEDSSSLPIPSSPGTTPPTTTEPPPSRSSEWTPTTDWSQIPTIWGRQQRETPTSSRYAEPTSSSHSRWTSSERRASPDPKIAEYDLHATPQISARHDFEDEVHLSPARTDDSDIINNLSQSGSTRRSLAPSLSVASSLRGSTGSAGAASNRPLLSAESSHITMEEMEAHFDPLPLRKSTIPQYDFTKYVFGQYKDSPERKRLSRSDLYPIGGTASGSSSRKILPAESGGDEATPRQADISAFSSSPLGISSAPASPQLTPRARVFDRVFSPYRPDESSPPTTEGQAATGTADAISLVRNSPTSPQMQHDYNIEFAGLRDRHVREETIKASMWPRQAPLQIPPHPQQGLQTASSVQERSSASCVSTPTSDPFEFDVALHFPLPPPRDAATGRLLTEDEAIGPRDPVSTGSHWIELMRMLDDLDAEQEYPIPKSATHRRWSSGNKTVDDLGASLQDRGPEHSQYRVYTSAPVFDSENLDAIKSIQKEIPHPVTTTKADLSWPSTLTDAIVDTMERDQADNGPLATPQSALPPRRDSLGWRAGSSVLPPHPASDPLNKGKGKMLLRHRSDSLPEERPEFKNVREDIQRLYDKSEDMALEVEAGLGVYARKRFQVPPHEPTELSHYPSTPGRMTVSQTLASLASPNIVSPRSVPTKTSITASKGLHDLSAEDRPAAISSASRIRQLFGETPSPTTTASQPVSASRDSPVSPTPARPARRLATASRPVPLVPYGPSSAGSWLSGRVASQVSPGPSPQRPSGSISASGSGSASTSALAGSSDRLMWPPPTRNNRDIEGDTPPWGRTGTLQVTNVRRPVTVVNVEEGQEETEVVISSMSVSASQQATGEAKGRIKGKGKGKSRV